MQPRSVAASSVQFMVGLEPEKTRKIGSFESSRKMSDDRRASLKPVFNSLHNINFEQIGKVEKKPALIAATNSLDLIIKRGSVRYLEPKDDLEEMEELEIEEPRNKHNEEKKRSLSILKNKTSVDEPLFDKEIRGMDQNTIYTLYFLTVNIYLDILQFI